MIGFSYISDYAHVYFSKSILMAWAIKYLEFWRESSKDPTGVLENLLEESMAGLLPNKQDQWTKGLAAVVLASTLVNNVYSICQLFSISIFHFKNDLRRYCFTSFRRENPVKADLLTHLLPQYLKSYRKIWLTSI